MGLIILCFCYASRQYHDGGKSKTYKDGVVSPEQISTERLITKPQEVSFTIRPSGDEQITKTDSPICKSRFLQARQYSKNVIQ